MAGTIIVRNNAGEQENRATKDVIAQSALAQSPAAAGLDLTQEIIVCTPYDDIVEYQGTRAALEAEGSIPAGTQWPEGFKDLEWTAGQTRYWLRRQIPKGAKGPRKQVIDGDWWRLRCDPLNAKTVDERIVERKEKELADTIHRRSPEGSAEWNREYLRFTEAESDFAFQSFKSLIPGLVKPKRGRRPMSAGQTSEARTISGEAE